MRRRFSEVALNEPQSTQIMMALEGPYTAQNFCEKMQLKVYWIVQVPINTLGGVSTGMDPQQMAISFFKVLTSVSLLDIVTLF